MTITIQESTDISLKTDIKKITQIQNAPASLSGQDSSKNVSYIDFQKKKNVTEQGIYNSWYDKWLDIKRACDPSKTIVHEAITFIAALEFLFLKNPDEIIFNKELLKKKCKQGPRQRSRFLAQLANIYEITPHTSYDYKGKKYHFIYSAKRTENSLVILKNPQEFYRKCQSNLTCIHDKNDSDTSQKCLVSKTNLTTSYTTNPSSTQGLQEHRNTVETTVETVVEDKSLSYAKGDLSSYKSSILKTETNTRACDPVQKNPQDQHATFAPCSLTKPEQVASLGVKESVTATIANQRNKLQEVQQALRTILGERKAEEIRVYCEIIELEPDKVGIYTGALPINDIDKVKICKAIASVYGNNVQITKVNTRPSRQQEQEEIGKNIPPSILPQYDWSKKATWNDFKISIINNSNNPFALTAIFKMPMLKVTEELGRVIIESEPDLIDQLSSPIWYLEDMERAVIETGLTLELKVDNNHSECKDTPQKVVVLAPEEIIKKLKLAWYKKQEERRKYEIFKSRHGIV